MLPLTYQHVANLILAQVFCTKKVNSVLFIY